MLLSILKSGWKTMSRDMVMPTQPRAYFASKKRGGGGYSRSGTDNRPPKSTENDTNTAQKQESHGNAQAQEAKLNASQHEQPRNERQTPVKHEDHGHQEKTQRRKPTKEELSRKFKLQDIAHMEYKKYSAAFDPKSKGYVHSERDDADMKYKIEGHNYLVDRLKADIKMQEQVYDMLEKMERPYKHGLPGVHKYLSTGLKDYFPPGDLGFKVHTEDDEAEFMNSKMRNQDRWTNQTIYTPKYAPMKHHDIEWQHEVDHRPVNPHFHPDKGYKFDVLTPWEQRYPHVADRLGYPEILGTPFERLMRLEGDIFHPVYLDQPFVQVPKAEPSESLTFEEGEVIYENTRILEWAKFLNLTGLGTYLFGCVFVPYCLIYKTHLTMPWGYDHLFVPTYNNTPFYFDNNGLQIPLVGGVALYTSYIAAALANTFWKDYVVKLQYNKDKELVFVTRISPYGSTEEEVFEVAHLESLPPSVRSGLQDMSAQDDDGLFDVTCMNTQKSLVLYKEDKYWNPNLRKEFVDKVTNLWTPDLYTEGIARRIENAKTAPKIIIGGDEHHDHHDVKKIDDHKATQTHH